MDRNKAKKKCDAHLANCREHEADSRACGPARGRLKSDMSNNKLKLKLSRSGRGRAAVSLHFTMSNLARAPAGSIISDGIKASHFDSGVMITCGGALRLPLPDRV